MKEMKVWADGEILVLRYNDSPPNLRTVSDEEIYKSGFFTWAKSKPIFKQCPVPDSQYAYASADYYPLDPLDEAATAGVAFRFDYTTKRIVWYRWGCEHKMGQRNVGKCLTEYKCIKCGFKRTLDSSD